MRWWETSDPGMELESERFVAMAEDPDPVSRRRVAAAAAVGVTHWLCVWLCVWLPTCRAMLHGVWKAHLLLSVRVSTQTHQDRCRA